MAVNHERPPFITQQRNNWADGKFLSVGLDVDLKKTPEEPEKFAKRIVDATASFVTAYKPNWAFFTETDKRTAALENIVGYIHKVAPNVSVIGDVKIGDIGNTMQGYARTMFKRFDFDAITVNPFLGEDMYIPLLDFEGRGLIILDRTTNPGSATYQGAPIDVEIHRLKLLMESFKNKEVMPLTQTELTKAHISSRYYKEALRKDLEAQGIDWRNVDPGRDLISLASLVAIRTATLAEQNPNYALVVGATHPEEFIPARLVAQKLPYLIPGIGTQGGDLELTLKHAPDKNGEGIIINSASAIIYAKDPYIAALNQDNQIREGLKTRAA